MATHILLPPSEAKNPGGDTPWEPDDSEIGVARREVASRLTAFARRSSRAKAASLFGVNGVNLDRALESARSGIVGTPSLSASDRYCGVVWSHFGVGTLDAPAVRYARSHVWVVSALGGVFRLDEPTPDYRLKMSASLARVGVLARWWRPKLEAVAQQWRSDTVVDLLPKEHAVALDTNGIARHTVRVRFVTCDGSAAAGHGAKAAKGALTRALVENRGRKPLDVCRSFETPQGFVAPFAFMDASQTQGLTTVRIAAVKPGPPDPRPR